MYLEILDKFADLAAKKVNYKKQSPSRFFIGAMMAGAYLGLAIMPWSTLGNATSGMFFMGVANCYASQLSIAGQTEPGDAEELASVLHTNGRKITGKLAEERES